MVELVAVAEEAAVAARAAKAVQAVTMGVVGVMVVSVGTLINIVMAMAVQAVLEALAVLVEGEMDIITTMLMLYGKNQIITLTMELVEQGVLRVPVAQVEQHREAQVVREAKEEDLNKLETMVLKVELVAQEQVNMVVVA
tara:strand:+ start:218 stop:637 length:420 start_codon:yes stop_codon:yes gene_type:complete